MSTNLDQLISAPLLPLREQWRSARRADEIAAARALHDIDPDDYWVWAARQQRWMRPWHTVRTGDLRNFRYFAGGLINVADNCVDRWAQQPASAARTAVIWEGEPGETRTMTYGELAQEVSCLAAGLLDLGIRQGDVVAVYMPNMVEVFTAIHACHRIGAIYTVLFSGFGVDAVASRLRVAGAKAVIVADASYRRGKRVELLANLRLACDRLPQRPRVVVVNRTGHEEPLRDNEFSYAALVRAHPQGTPVVPLDPNDPAFLIFTSGTESAPKGVVHSVAGFLIGAWANVHWQAGFDEGDVYWVAADVGWLSFPIHAVVGGLANQMTIACYEGALDTPTTARFYEFCERHRVTKVLAAPTVLRMLRKFGDELTVRHPLRNLRLVTVQGEPLDPETFDWASAHLAGGVAVTSAYGQTETGSAWCYPVVGVDELKPGSVGRPLPGHVAEIVDDDGNLLPAGVKGNLVLNRPFPTLARTVWQDHQRYLTGGFTRFPGRYCTNDEAVRDQDGHIWVLGRSDDVINVAAHRISTLEIEAIMGHHPKVAEAAVVGIPHETKGTVPVGVITLISDVDERGIESEVNSLVENEIGRYASLARVYVSKALPKTRSGKIMRRLLRDVIVAGRPQTDTSALEDAAALDAVLSVVTADRK
jgi:acetyl-CoA synthetase